MTTRALVALPVALVALVIAPAAVAQQRTVSLLSDGPFSVDANVDPTFIGASDDGSRAFFETTEILATTDTDAVGDVYARTAAARSSTSPTIRPAPTRTPRHLSPVGRAMGYAPSSTRAKASP